MPVLLVLHNQGTVSATWPFSVRKDDTKLYGHEVSWIVNFPNCGVIPPTYFAIGQQSGHNAVLRSSLDVALVVQIYVSTNEFRLVSVRATDIDPDGYLRYMQVPHTQGAQVQWHRYCRDCHEVMTLGHYG